MSDILPKVQTWARIAGEHESGVADVDAETLRDAAFEIERLRASLKAVNANAEQFEREWYLRGDEIERLQIDITEFTEAADELGQALFGTESESGAKLWREAKASWWQRLKQAVEKQEKARQT